MAVVALTSEREETRLREMQANFDASQAARIRGMVEHQTAIVEMERLRLSSTPADDDEPHRPQLVEDPGYRAVRTSDGGGDA